MSVKTQTAKSFSGQTGAHFEIRYLLHVPRAYRTRGEEFWPVILFLHGAGERGSALSKIRKHGLPRLAQADPDFPFILISPQCPAGETWKDQELLALLDHVLGSHRADRTRVYLTGLSMGGFGAFSLGLRNPRRFAAVAAICGGGDILPALLPSRQNASAIKQLPVWVFHGGRDDVVPLSESERMVDALKRAGNERVRLTVYPDAGHDSWTETYRNRELYDWFLSHKAREKSS